MAATSQFSVTNSAATAVTTVSFCRNVRVTENRGVVGWPTSDFLIYKPDGNATPVRIQAGSQYTFNAPPSFFKPGQIVGYVKMVTGTTTFDQDEDQT